MLKFVLGGILYRVIWCHTKSAFNGNRVTQCFIARDKDRIVVASGMSVTYKGEQFSRELARKWSLSRAARTMYTKRNMNSRQDGWRGVVFRNRQKRFVRSVFELYRTKMTQQPRWQLV